jgi:hypothetical protein
MVWMLVTALVLLWLVLNLAALTVGGLVHPLLGAAIVLAGLRLWRRRAARAASPP